MTAAPWLKVFRVPGTFGLRRPEVLERVEAHLRDAGLHWDGLRSFVRMTIGHDSGCPILADAKDRCACGTVTVHATGPLTIDECPEALEKIPPVTEVVQ